MEASTEERKQSESTSGDGKRNVGRIEEILQRLVPAYVEISVFRALLESTASEHGARMTAMRNASENAGDLIKDLTLQMNRERQAEITQEILEGAFEGLGARAAGDENEEEAESTGHTALTEYEPDPEDILQRLVPAYVEISLFRALLESTASEHGARMTAMRNASENAGDIIKDLTLQMNRERQAEITQEILEVVSGAEGLR